MASTLQDNSILNNIRNYGTLNSMVNIESIENITDGKSRYTHLLTLTVDADINPTGEYVTLKSTQLADGRLMHSNLWIEADGWFTDAYMFTVTYEEGTNPADSKELFICYGSGLRRDKTSYFSSLSKLFVIQKEENKQLKLWIEGQSKINANFRSERCPSSVTVNDKVIPTIYEHSIVKVKQ